ncbi:hypothetical protein NDU88_001507 [Pleurodeles waltl]|uniref:Uncharacterized protein n=1 Tax=Pleurodeles waltl TaxID=8319 RepID=A0AAV7KT10_PLEWA|nr:hypothetical protein NDU88_001507 [Pleurodeles waltl]
MAMLRNFQDRDDILKQACAHGSWQLIDHERLYFFTPAVEAWAWLESKDCPPRGSHWEKRIVGIDRGRNASRNANPEQPQPGAKKKLRG